jgi:hypothetical protein
VAVRTLTAALIVAAAVAAPGAQSITRPGAPESFRANGQILGEAGGAASTIHIQIDKYTSDADHAALAGTLKQGGYEAFVAALRKAPPIGSVKIGDRSVAIHWARAQAQGGGRRIAVATAEPVFFGGGGAVDAKPTAGYDVAVAEFTVDSTGLGKGSMAPAAKVKAGGATGVEIEDYSGKKIELVTVSRNLSGK